MNLKEILEDYIFIYEDKKEQAKRHRIRTGLVYKILDDKIEAARRELQKI